MAQYIGTIVSMETLGMVKNSDSNNPKSKEPEVDFSQFTMDDIAKRVLDTPPKPKIKKEKDKI
jgi:hypothetical protein